MAAPLRVGIDIGGTFTDFVIYAPQTAHLETFKLLSTPSDPSQAVLEGLSRIRSRHPSPLSLQIVHGSTVATNALLERKGANVAFITTEGFKDLLQIGRQNRPDLYDLFADPSPALVEPANRFEISERVGSQGEIIRELDPVQVAALPGLLAQAGVEAVAICLLFSFLHPDHEATVAQELRSAGYNVSVSSEILPEFREYERASTTTVNAYVSPVLERYLSRLETALADQKGSSLRVMQSNGGSLSLAAARRLGVHCILSGPAGGVVGAQRLLAVSPGLPRCLLTFDMGGTSTDVSLVDGDPALTTEAVIGGCPIRIPLLDIHTIGAGGGSIAYADAGGALRVGPASAGANPGPACYGRGEDATVTDANLVLGRIDPDAFLGGALPLYPGRAMQALAKLGSQLGLDPMQAALGVVEVANAHMEQALRLISVERGHDPRLFTLFSFGGGGGLHAVELARRLGIRTIVAPPLASTLSAFGMLAADIVKDYSQTVMLPGSMPYANLQALFRPWMQRGLLEVLSEGAAKADTDIEQSLDMRLRGQSYELSVPFTPGFLQDFHALHTRAYGYTRPELAVEIVTLRLRVIGRVQPPLLEPLIPSGIDASQAFLGLRKLALDCSGTPAWCEVPFFQGERLLPGNCLDGPAVVMRSDTTILLAPGDSAQVDSLGNLTIQVGA
jgi:N-methylhydantoinase A